METFLYEIMEIYAYFWFFAKKNSSVYLISTIKIKIQNVLQGETKENNLSWGKAVRYGLQHRNRFAGSLPRNALYQPITSTFASYSPMQAIELQETFKKACWTSLWGVWFCPKLKSVSSIIQTFIQTRFKFFFCLHGSTKELALNLFRD